jgi:hypothetical protein
MNEYWKAKVIPELAGTSNCSLLVAHIIWCSVWQLKVEVNEKARE